MEKIHNNLNIENLIKTDWFEQFSINQKQEILKGLEEDVDVSIYAKPDFDCFQMEEIRLGLGCNLDVSQYAKKEFVWFQMREIRKRKVRLKSVLFFYSKKQFFKNIFVCSESISNFRC